MPAVWSRRAGISQVGIPQARMPAMRKRPFRHIWTAATLFTHVAKPAAHCNAAALLTPILLSKDSLGSSRVSAGCYHSCTPNGRRLPADTRSRSPRSTSNKT
eukprot:2965812-Pleurochrysis_carterae.AAC.1